MVWVVILDNIWALAVSVGITLECGAKTNIDAKNKGERRTYEKSMCTAIGTKTAARGAKYLRGKGVPPHTLCIVHIFTARCVAPVPKMRHLAEASKTQDWPGRQMQTT